MIVVTDTSVEKSIYDGRLTFSQNQLSYAPTLSTKAFQLKALDLGIQSATGLLPDAHAMVRFQVQHTLADLYLAKAKVHKESFQFCKAFKTNKEANFHNQLAMKEGASSRFAWGFLQGLLKHQGNQFNATQTRDLKRLLNATAYDLRSVEEVANAYLAHFNSLTSQILALEATKNSKIAEKRQNSELYLKYDKERSEMSYLGLPDFEAYLQSPQRFYQGLSYNLFNSREIELNNAKVDEISNKVKEYRGAWQQGMKEVRDLENQWTVLQSKKESLQPLKEYIELLNEIKIPQTYAEELPHRPKLRALGVQFEPYPNA